MIYLIIQIAFILGVALLAGLAIGWWGHGKITTTQPALREVADDPFDARFRLEQCHRDNAALRRDLKDTEERVEKLQARLANAETSDGDVLEQLEIYKIRVQALMEDLQMRDDTVAVLERELEVSRAGKS